MKWVSILFPAIGVFMFQFLLVDFLSLNMIRPDFIVVYVFYISLVYGKTTGIFTGFLLGLLSDLSGVGSFFGLSPLSLSVTAYFTGYLNGKYERMLPYLFHGAWISIIGFHFIIISYVRFQSILLSDPISFWIKCLMSFSYTMMFLLIIQFFYPVKEASHAEIN